MTPIQALIRTLIDRRSDAERKALKELRKLMLEDRNGDCDVAVPRPVLDTRASEVPSQDRGADA